MIGQLKGTVAQIGEDGLLLDVGGVGYEVSATPRLLARLSAGQDCTLTIETLVAETYIRLVGFSSIEERRAFRLLQTVQGVGAKAALAILTVLTPDGLMDAVTFEDKTAIAKAQGVGPKLAGRIVSELKGKTSGLAGSGLRPAVTAPASANDTPAGGARSDAVAALVSLGFDEPQAMRAVRTVPATDDETAEALIPAALKALGAA